VRAVSATYLTAARRQAGGDATTTRAATAKTARKVEAFANMVSDLVFGVLGWWVLVEFGVKEDGEKSK
jgi:hypothetical protein